MSEVTSSQNANKSNNVTGGDDYTAGPYDVIIPAGQRRAPFDVGINDNNVLEADEEFTLTIIASSLPTGVSRTSPFSATVTIQDDDRE